jgi:hypothetical protein
VEEAGGHAERVQPVNPLESNLDRAAVLVLRETPQFRPYVTCDSAQQLAGGSHSSPSLDIFSFVPGTYRSDQTYRNFHAVASIRLQPMAEPQPPACAPSSVLEEETQAHSDVDVHLSPFDPVNPFSLNHGNRSRKFPVFQALRQA